MVLGGEYHSSDKEFPLEKVLENKFADMLVARKIPKFPRLPRIFSPAQPVAVNLLRINATPGANLLKVSLPDVLPKLSDCPELVSLSIHA